MHALFMHTLRSFTWFAARVRVELKSHLNAGKATIPVAVIARLWFNRDQRGLYVSD